MTGWGANFRWEKQDVRWSSDQFKGTKLANTEAKNRSMSPTSDQRHFLQWSPAPVGEFLSGILPLYLQPLTGNNTPEKCFQTIVEKTGMPREAVGGTSLSNIGHDLQASGLVSS